MTKHLRPGVTLFFVGVFVGTLLIASMQPYIRWTVIIGLLVLLAALWTLPEMLTGNKQRVIKRLQSRKRVSTKKVRSSI